MLCVAGFFLSRDPWHYCNLIMLMQLREVSAKALDWMNYDNGLLKWQI